MIPLLLDAGGPLVHLGGPPVRIDHTGLVLVADVLAGRPVAADAASGHRALIDRVRALLAAGEAAAAPAPGDPSPFPTRGRSVAAFDPDGLLQAAFPVPVLASAAGFQVWPVGGGAAVVLDAHEVGVLSCFVEPRRTSALGPEVQPRNPLLADPSVRNAAVAHLCAQALLTDDTAVTSRDTWGQRRSTTRRIHPRTRTLVRQQSELLSARAPRAGRTPVYAVERTAPTKAPLALGLLFSAAMAHDGGALQRRYDFVPDWHVRPGHLRRILADGPAVFLFSNYVWSTPENHAFSARVKELSPRSLIVHGGPDTPKYPGDRERYFAEHPWVDVAVHGEGEATTTELLAVLDGDLDGDRRRLADVAGITFRPAPGEAPVTTADRPRLEDLDALPSPYLTGLFDAWRSASVMTTVETNRGCPYGCTFCDWGSATNARIRKFSIDRVFAEIEWAATAQTPMLYLADANFGIFERDVAIAEHVAAMKAQHGFPERVMVSYAKNTVKHLQRIVEILSEARLDVNGNMSVQTFDPEVLRITNRKNLKEAEFERLARTFRDAQMPMLSDVMIGLPGATVASTMVDLQGLIEHEVNANIHPTSLLPNSPMNEPAYRERWAIVADDDGIVRSTASYDRADRAWMDRAVAAFHAAETYGILRQVLRWLAVTTGEREVDVLEAMRVQAEQDPASFPLLAYVLEHFLDTTTPPGPWTLVLDEVERLAVETWSIDPADSAWRAVRTLQLHVLPDRGRAFPDVVELEHDVVAWLRDLTDARRTGATVAPLRDYPPAAVEVSDPFDTCATVGDQHPMTDYHSFELAWPMARHRAYRWSAD